MVYHGKGVKNTDGTDKHVWSGASASVRIQDTILELHWMIITELQP